MWLRAWLRHRGYDATLVHNITDVNDKIYDAAPGASAELAEQATRWYLEDTGDLGLGMPDGLPKATDAVPSIVAFIEKLVDAGRAYEASGDVYFSVSADPGYGRLSRQKVENMEPEEVSPLKRAPQDFALWKATKLGEDTSWNSPWGAGRPGWHIECSVMAEEAFGPVFEIHGGGLDLVFPHHENELAQSLALGHDFARIWMHNGLLTRSGEKMSKSLGNVLDPFEVIERFGADALRYYCFREVSFGQDGSVSAAGFESRYETELANDYGNLASRVLAMVDRYRDGTVPQAQVDAVLMEDFEGAPDRLAGLLDKAELSQALEVAWVLVRRLNRYVEETAPWVLAKDEADPARLDEVLYNLVEGIRVVTLMLVPYLPETAATLLAVLGEEGRGLAELGSREGGQQVERIQPLFPKIDSPA